jgi:hypothetical protein
MPAQPQFLYRDEIVGPPAGASDLLQHLHAPFGQHAQRWSSLRPSDAASGPALSESSDVIRRTESVLRTPPLQYRALPLMRIALFPKLPE